MNIIIETLIWMQIGYALIFGGGALLYAWFMRRPIDD
jgi:hypothetical protein